jgi:hypothetical protein
MRELGAVTACYTHPFDGLKAGVWRTIIIPFYSLEWSGTSLDASTDALPARDVIAADLLIAHAETAWFDVSRIIFERPRTSGVFMGTVIAGGRVWPRKKGIRVNLNRVDGLSEFTAHAYTDERGGFVFGDMPPGGYECWIGNSKRKKQFECLYDRYDLLLNRLPL